MTTHLWYGVYTQHIPSNGLTYHRHRTRPDDTERELCLYTSSLTLQPHVPPHLHLHGKARRRCAWG